MINYKGNFYSQLLKAFENNREKTIGEILHCFLHRNKLGGKELFYATDEEIYSSIERFNKEKKETEVDEPLEERAFIFWVEQQMIIKD